MQLRVEPTVRDELDVRSAFDDAAAVQDEDDVRIANRRDPDTHHMDDYVLYVPGNLALLLCRPPLP